MRGLLVGLLMAFSLPALAQGPPAPSPETGHSPRPEARPEARPESAKPPAKPEAEAPAPPVAVPEAAPETAMQTEPETGTKTGGETRSETGPEAETKAGPEPADKASAPTPPMRETLREDDFLYSACLLDLTILGADYSEIAPITDPEHRDCGIARPILLRAPLPGIEIAGGAPMRCETAWHLAHWLKDFVRPASALLPGQPGLTGIEPGSTYQCRPTVGNGDSGGKLSEHAFGNAFDVAALRFRDGSRVEIAPRQDSGDMVEAFQRAIRGAACLHFTTVLGPGANAAHDNHLHLDIKSRKHGWRLCQ